MAQERTERDAGEGESGPGCGGGQDDAVEPRQPFAVQIGARHFPPQPEIEAGLQHIHQHQRDRTKLCQQFGGVAFLAGQQRQK